MTKRGALAIHKYCGLCAALLIFVQALSGMALVYRDTLGQWLQPNAMVRRTAGTDVSPGAILLTAQRHFPDHQIRRLVFPKGEEGVFFVWMADGREQMSYATIDPGNAAILSRGGLWRYPIEALLSVHYQLTAGKPGMAIVCLTGLSLLFLVVSGLVYWWPRGNRLLKALVVKRNIPGRFAVRQWHRTVGVLAAALLCISAITGLVVLVDIMLAPAGSPAWGIQRFDRADRAVAMASARFPGYPIRDIRMPSPEGLKVNFEATERNPEIVATVSVDLLTLDVKQVKDARAAIDPIATLLSIHDGTLFGPIGLVMVFLLGLTLAFLAISGPLGWYLVARRKGNKASSKQLRR